MQNTFEIGEKINYSISGNDVIAVVLEDLGSSVLAITHFVGVKPHVQKVEVEKLLIKTK